MPAETRSPAAATGRGEPRASIGVALFAREPRPGRTKTRLEPAVGAAGAARLYAAFLADAVERLAGCPELHLSIWVADAADRAAMRERFPGRTVRAQPPGDLGARMGHAMEVALRTHDKVLVVGSDAPTLPAASLRAASRALDRAELVVGPCADGGYYLIGARERALSFGSSIRWSTRHALADTLARARELGRSVASIGPWYDVDTPADLALLRAHLALRPAAAPNTAEALSRLASRSFDRATERG